MNANTTRPQPARRRRALKVLAGFKPRRKAPAVWPRLLAFGSAGLAAILLLWWLLTPPVQPRPDAPQAPLPVQAKASHHSPSPLPDKKDATGVSQADDPIFITAVRITPSRPTREDTLRAEVTPAPDAPADLSVVYLWRVNDVPVGQGETLKYPHLKKGDLVFVTATPYSGNRPGAAVSAPPVRVYGIPPSLSLEMAKTRVTDPLVLELSCKAPDSKTLTFALEEPFLEGMSIDGTSGRITWRRPAEAKGTFRFGASVTDEEGTKVSCVFEMTVQ